MPIINKLYGGDGTEYDLPSSGSNVIETVGSGNNILNPEYFANSNFYYDFTDGKTHKSAQCRLTSKSIYVGETETLYFVLKKTFNRFCVVYCYDFDGNYLGYEGMSPNALSKSVTLKPNTRYIHFYYGGTDAASDDFCISKTELNAFENFVGVDKVETEYIPKMAELDSIEEYSVQAIKHNALYKKEVVVFGDSIMNAGNITNRIARLTGVVMHNCAISGSSARLRSLDGWDSISMNRLAYAIANDDYTEQGTHEVVAKLQAIDFSKVDTIILGYGFNDGKDHLDNAENRLDCTTYCGALRYSIETILAVYPQIKFYSLSQIYHQDTSTQTEKVQDALISEANANMCAEMHIKAIDNLHIGMNGANYTYYYSNGDYVHPNSNGAELMARNIARHLI